MSGYDKMLLLQSMWPLPLDCYILKFPEGAEIAPHVDAVKHTPNVEQDRRFLTGKLPTPHMLKYR